MAGRLVSVTANNPGVNGLNLESEVGALGPDWASTATNCVVDGSGKLACRKGWAKTNTSAISGTPDVEQVFEYKDNSGTNVDIICANNKIYKNSASPTDITGSVTITANNWKFQNFNGNVVGYQAGHEPIIWKGTGNFTYLVDENTQWAASTAVSLKDVVVPTTRNGYYYECTTAGTTNDTEGEPTWSTTEGGTTTEADGVVWTTRAIAKSNEVLSAWGRTWIIDPVDDMTVRYSDLLIPYDYHGGSAGSINLNSVLTGGTDRLTSLAAFNSSLIIFGKDTTTVYQGADDVTASTFSLAEVIDGTGCLARDSVQQVDEDIFYLHRSGVRSLKRDLVRNKMPMATITHNIRDSIVSKIKVEDVDKIRSVFHASDSFYLITFPASSLLYCIDVRRYLSENHVSIYQWDSIKPLALYEREDGELLMGFTGGFCGTYSGYDDNSAGYSLAFKSAWVDPQQHIDASLSAKEVILKKYSAQIHSIGSLTATFNWYYDYAISPHSTRVISLLAQTTSEWGENGTEWGVSLWSGGTTTHKFHTSTTGSGKIFSFGLTVPIAGDEVVYFGANLQFQVGRVG